MKGHRATYLAVTCRKEMPSISVTRRSTKGTAGECGLKAQLLKASLTTLTVKECACQYVSLEYVHGSSLVGTKTAWSIARVSSHTCTNVSRRAIDVQQELCFPQSSTVTNRLEPRATAMTCQAGLRELNEDRTQGCKMQDST